MHQLTLDLNSLILFSIIHRLYNIQPEYLLEHTFSLVAEAGGFEPPVRLPVRQFSKLLVSATHPNFQSSLGTHLLSNAVQI